MEQNIKLVIEDKLDTLSKMEAKIGKYILDNIKLFLDLDCNVQELAQRANTSSASVTRFCKSINVKNLTELKILLNKNKEMFDLDDEVQMNEEISNIQLKLLARNHHILEQTNSEIDNKQIEKVIMLLKKADRIYTWGIGSSALVAEDFYQKFNRLGKNVFTTRDSHLLITAMSAFPQTGVLFLVSESGMKKENMKLAKIAKDNNIKVISVVANKEGLLNPYSDYLLYSQKGSNSLLRSGATISLTSQLYIVDIIFLAYVAKNYKESLKKLKSTSKNIDLLS